MEKILSKFATYCDKIGGRLLLLSLLAVPILYFTWRSLTIYGVIALGIGLALFTIGAFIQLSLENASKPKSREELEAHASALAKDWVAEFEVKYG